MAETEASLLSGSQGLVMGVANDHSIAWGIARVLAQHGAKLAFSYQGQGFARRVEPLAHSVGSDLVLPCDVADDASLDSMFSTIREKWKRLDFVIHAIAYSDKDELKGGYSTTTRDNFRKTLDISCYSFTAVAQRAAPLMSDGGGLITLTYAGAERVIPGYNVMGVAKAALEASVRYLAADLGSRKIRVNAISAGPVRTLAGSAIGSARHIFRWSAAAAPLGENAGLDDIGRAALFLLSPLASGVTGEVLHVDGGVHAVAMPRPDQTPAPEGA